MNLRNYLQTRTKSTVTLIALGLTVVVGALDYWTGPQLAFSIFYFIPIGLAAWYAGQPAGVGIAILSVTLWRVVKVLEPHASLSVGVQIWNCVAHFGIFLVVALALAKFKALRDSLERQVAERTASLKKADTNAANAALFPEENPAPVLRANGAGKLLYANRAAADLLERWHCTLAEPVPEPVRTAVAATLASGQARELEVPCGTRSLSFILVPIADRGYVNFYGRDITKRKQLEAAAKLQFAQLASEEMFDAAFWIRPDGRFVHVNAAACRQLGYSRAELLALCVTDLDSDMSPERWAQGWRETKRVQHRIFEARHRTKEGRVLPVELTVSHLESDGQEYHFSIARDLTARRQAETTLRKNEEKYRQLIETTGTGFVVIDDQGRVTDANPEYVRLTGRGRLDEIVGHNVAEWTAPHDRDRNERAVRQCLEQGWVRNLEVDYLTPAGQISAIEINATVLRDDEVVQILTLCRDITERRQAEAAVRASKERLHRLLENSPDAVSIMDATTRTIWTTAAATRLLGYSAAEFKLWPVLELVHPDDLAGTRARQAQVLAAPGAVVTGEARLRHKDGTWHWIDWRAANLLAEPCVSGLVVNFLDITERKNAEAAVQESAERYRSLFEQAADGIVLFDPQTLGFVDFNDEACRRLGYSRAEFAKLTIPDFEVLESAAAVRRRVLSIPTDLVIEFETKQRTKTGEVLDIAIRAKTIRLGQRQLVQGLWRDITERNRTAQALLEEQEKMALAVAGSNGAPWEIPMDPAQPDVIPDKLIASPRLKEFIGFRDDEFPDSVAAWFARIHPDDLPAIGASSKNHVAGNTSGHHVEYRIRHKDGSWRWIASQGRLFRDAHGRPVRWAGIDWDITDRKRTEAELERLVLERTQELQATQARLQNIYDSSQDAIAFSDLNGRLLEFNRAHEALTGYSRVELQQMTFHQLTPPEFHELTRRMIAEVIRTGKTVRFEKDICRKDGTRIPVALTIWPVSDQAGQLTGLAAIIHNATEQHRLQREILEVSDRERRRIGQDLHDDLCQMLTGITFAAGSLEQRLAADNLPAAGAAHAIGELLQRANREAHNIARGLYPVELEAGGLPAALQRLADDITRAGKVRCELLCDTTVAVPDQTQALHIYRIVQEAVANALRHGLATVISITFAVTDGQVHLEVANNGRDWPAEAAPAAGMGLNIMAYRARMIGGTLQICRGATGGTVVEVTLPVV